MWSLKAPCQWGEFAWVCCLTFSTSAWIFLRGLEHLCCPRRCAANATGGSWTIQRWSRQACRATPRTGFEVERPAGTSRSIKVRAKLQAFRKSRCESLKFRLKLRFSHGSSPPARKPSVFPADWRSSSTSQIRLRASPWRSCGSSCWATFIPGATANSNVVASVAVLL